MPGLNGTIMNKVAGDVTAADARYGTAQMQLDTHR